MLTFLVGGTVCSMHLDGDGGGGPGILEMYSLPLNILGDIITSTANSIITLYYGELSWEIFLNQICCYH